MFVEFFFLFIVIAKCIWDDCGKRENCAKLREQGAFLPTNSAERDRLLTRYNVNIALEDGTCVPEKYRRYLKKYSNARIAYIEGLVSQEEIRLGRQPSFCNGTYNKHTFDPFKKFNTLYAKDCEDYINKAGRWENYPESIY